MRKLNDISFVLIILFMVSSIVYYEEPWIRRTLAWATLILAIVWMMMRITRKNQNKKLIRGRG